MITHVNEAKDIRASRFSNSFSALLSNWVPEKYPQNKKFYRYHLADYLGISAGYLTNLCKGRRRPSEPTLLRICVRLDDFIHEVYQEKGELEVYLKFKGEFKIKQGIWWGLLDFRPLFD